MFLRRGFCGASVRAEQRAYHAETFFRSSDQAHEVEADLSAFPRRQAGSGRGYTRRWRGKARERASMMPGKDTMILTRESTVAGPR